MPHNCHERSRPVNKSIVFDFDYLPIFYRVFFYCVHKIAIEFCNRNRFTTKSPLVQFLWSWLARTQKQSPDEVRGAIKCDGGCGGVYSHCFVNPRYLYIREVLQGSSNSRVVFLVHTDMQCQLLSKSDSRLRQVCK